jgi:flagellar basal-body rod protein FlgF
MDRMIYIAMTGAKHILSQQATVTQNLANVTTSGFRAQVDAFRAVPVIGPGMATRAYVIDATVGSDFKPGVIQTTGRDLDVAVNGKGWIAVQNADGKEGYTRYGSLAVNANGLVQTRTGLNVLGTGGTLAIPPDSDITIAKDGTVSVVPTGGARNQVTEVGRIKLVNPPEANLVRGDDGLFHLRDGGTADADESVTLHSGGLESSNVNASEVLVNMISLSRQFDLHMKLLQTAQQNDAKAAQILTPNG